MTIHRVDYQSNELVEPDPQIESNGNQDSDCVTTQTNLESLWPELGAAAEQGDAQAYIDTQQLINWNERTAAEFEQAIHWALTAGAHLTARSLAQSGFAKHPDHAYLQKAARILAPPKLLRRLPAEPTKLFNHQWLRANRTQYRGQWVALRDGQLLASGDSFKALTEVHEIAPEILFTKVF